MPTSKPFSASSFADSCPIPESEAVTIATGLMLSPLVPKEYAHPALCPRSEEHKQNTVYTSRNRTYLQKRDRVCWEVRFCELRHDRVLSRWFILHSQTRV